MYRREAVSDTAFERGRRDEAGRDTTSVNMIGFAWPSRDSRLGIDWHEFGAIHP